DYLLADVLNFKYVSLGEILENSDIISLHIPYLPQTHHLLNVDNMKMIKRKPLLINTARGGLVDTEMMIKALDEGIISGAGIDVIECEKILTNPEECRMADQCDCSSSFERLKMTNLFKRDNVIFTPHMAFDSKEAIMRILDITAENIKSFYAGTPQNIVNS
ncbi:MAG: NAD(P)-dependent oxidoreductase, partial [Candidatus Margulisbacteria bacterium]|nr:NAD(P)-dependent oxidoreductase [Candidatus Margulisiibacteriota bacterium]